MNDEEIRARRKNPIKLPPRKVYHLGLIGYPLGHSRSPQLHHAALQAAGKLGEYRLFAIPPTEEGKEEIEGLIGLMRAGELDGLNVTIPHKGTVIPFMDRLTEEAQAVGAVNTISRLMDGTIVGDNTDVQGFLFDLRRLLPYGRTGEALVLGAGGSARAVAYALASEGWNVRVLARRPDQAAELVEKLSQNNVSGRMVSGDLHDLPVHAGPECGLVVNTTPLGMHPNTEGCPWPEDLALPPLAAVYDLIYNPSETVLLRRAREAGLNVRNGTGMLVAQAAFAFAHWTATIPPFEIMENALR